MKNIYLYLLACAASEMCLYASQMEITNNKPNLKRSAPTSVESIEKEAQAGQLTARPQPKIVSSKLDPLLFKAVALNEIGEVNALFAKPVIPNINTVLQIPNKPLMNPLILAIAAPHIDMVKALISYGADVNQIIGEYTPLTFAIKQNQPPIVQLLLNSSANPDKEVNELTALAFSMLKPNKEIIGMLLKAGANPANGLFVATLKNQPELVKLLLAAKANPNSIYPENGATPLMMAAEANLTNIAQILLTAGANPNQTEPEGRTALMLALEKSQEGDDMTSMVKLLLNNGANPYLKNKEGVSTLEYSKEGSGEEKILRQFAKLQQPEHRKELHNVTTQALTSRLGGSLTGGLISDLSENIQEMLRPAPQPQQVIDIEGDVKMQEAQQST